MRVPLLALLVGTLSFGACTTVEDVLGMDSGNVRFSCSAGGPLAGAPSLQSSLDALVPGVKLEILRAPPQSSVLLNMPAGEAGDVFGYSWQETVSGPGRAAGTWSCDTGWRYDGRAWRLIRFDARWSGAVPEQK